MKVLLIDVNCKDSSTGKIVYDLYSVVNESGGEAAVCYGRGGAIREHNIYKFGVDAETVAHALLTRVTGYTGCFSPISTQRLLRFIKAFRPDVVHLHELHAYFMDLEPVINYLKQQRIKTVMTLHCEFNYTGKCGHSVECEKWKTECGGCPHLHDYPISLFFDRTKAMFRQKKRLFSDFEDLTVAAPSKWLADRAKQSFLGTNEIVVIHNGVDTEVFSPKETARLREQHRIAADEKVVLAVAPDLMSKNKGGRYVLQLAEKMKDENVRFILIGVDEKMTADDPNVIILHRIYDKELLTQYYSLADVFVICSERENFPTTCLEAQCCGASVCGFDVGGVKETVLDPDALCAYGDLDALTDRVTQLLRSRDGSEKSETAKQAAERFGKDRMAKQYMELYAGVARSAEDQ